MTGTHRATRVPAGVTVLDMPQLQRLTRRRVDKSVVVLGLKSWCGLCTHFVESVLPGVASSLSRYPEVRICAVWLDTVESTEGMGRIFPRASISHVPCILFCPKNSDFAKAHVYGGSSGLDCAVEVSEWLEGEAHEHSTEVERRHALMIAAHQGDSTSVGSLLRLTSMSPDVKEPVAGRTALHVAAGEGHSRVINTLLLHHGANPNIKDRLGSTPMSLAAAAVNRSPRSVQALTMARGADPTVRNNGGFTPREIVRASTESEYESELRREVAGGPCYNGSGWRSVADGVAVEKMLRVAERAPLINKVKAYDGHAQ